MKNTPPCKLITEETITSALGQPESSAPVVHLLTQLETSPEVTHDPGQAASDPDFTMYLNYKREGVSLCFRGDRLSHIFIYFVARNGYLPFNGLICSIDTKTSVRELTERFGNPIKQSGDVHDPALWSASKWKLFQKKKLLIHAEHSESLHISLLTFHTDLRLL